ncbi:MAG: DUF5916 domain-containing protein [Rhodothermales bacterium]
MTLRFNLLRVAALCLSCCFFSTNAWAQPSADIDPVRASAKTAFTPNIAPALNVSQTSASITIDGDLTDAGWLQATRATNFSETFPDNLAKPPIGVEAWMTYDDKNLYIAYVIEDDPSEIRANLSDRDQIWQDDYVGIILDTNGDGQQTYFIASNALGIQGDTRSLNGDEDVNFNLIYSAEGRITDTGYQVEFAIPFRSLRFPQKDVQTWRGTFWITHPRDSRNTYSWAAIDNNNGCFACQFGDFGGIRGVKSGSNLEILPSLVGTQAAMLESRAEPNAGLSGQRFEAEPSLAVKYGITSNLTADVTVNPDFSQIEADADQIDVNSPFALAFPEQRPFFQEGANLFDTFLETLYTRSINDPSVAAKLTGRFGQTDVGYIGARDLTSPLLLPFEESSQLIEGGASFSNIIRARHSFGENTYMGAMVTDRRMDSGGGGTTVGVDGLKRLSNKYLIGAQYVFSNTNEVNDPTLTDGLGLGDLRFGDSYTGALDGETFSGHAFVIGAEREARVWNTELSYEQISPSFRADLGFIGQNNARRLNAEQAFVLFPKTNFIDRLIPFVEAQSEWNFDGEQKQAWVATGVNSQLKRQTNLLLLYVRSQQQFAGLDFNGMQFFRVNVNSNFSNPVQVGFNVRFGDGLYLNPDAPEVGQRNDINIWGTIRPTSRLSIQPRFSYQRLEDRDTGDAFFSGYILRSRINYQFTRRLFVRTVVQYNDFAERLEVDPLITYKINPFSAFYFGSTHDYLNLPRTGFDGDDLQTRFFASERQLFFKFQYLFRM